MPTDVWWGMLKKSTTWKNRRKREDNIKVDLKLEDGRTYTVFA